MDLSRLIDDYELIFLDLETTGLDVVTGDSICEIGAFKVKQRKIVDQFHSLINPNKNMPEEAYQIHKISDEELKNAPYFEVVAPKFLSFLGDCPICAYNVEFDVGFIDRQLRRMNHLSFNVTAIDILSMTRDLLNLPKYNLETVARFFNIDCSQGFHRAEGDAMIAYQVFSKLKEILADSGIEKLDDFISLYGGGTEIFRSQENHKVSMIKEAIDQNSNLKMRYFSPKNKIEAEEITPLRILQEDKYFQFWYKAKAGDSFSIKLNRALSIEGIT